MTAGGGQDFKAHNIHNGTTGCLRGVDLLVVDKEHVNNNALPKMVLTQVPKCLYVEVNGENMPCFGTLPQQWFPIQPHLVTWSINHSNSQVVRPQGFRTLESEKLKPAMKK